MNRNIQNQALNSLSSNFMDYEGSEYTGFGDPSLDFAGEGSSFLNEDKAPRTFGITVSNMGASAVDRVLCLHPGYLTELIDMTNTAGVAAAAVITDGDVIAEADKKVTATGKPKKISHLKAFVNRNPTRFTGLKMLVNNSDQFEEEITVKKLSPFKNMGDKVINPGEFKDSNQTDDKRVEIPLEDFQLDDQTLIVFTLKAGRTVTFTFFSGAIKNQAGELNKKAVIARKSAVRTY